ncbi:nitroreductase family protein [Nocardia sp. CC201C]|uniref:nitroreductase family protein n=1 Tax=Nocardia sp. CC201C TaxID=3044575 RepID=UPI0024A7C09B|nr:nitroreductase family protein [Nocardia sp. CC201C]
MSSYLTDIMSVATAIRTRRTIRHYRPDPVSAAALDTLAELAVAAPSSWNLQDRSLVVVTDPEVRATDGQPQPREAPVMLVFVAEPQAWRADRTDVSTWPAAMAPGRRSSSPDSTRRQADSSSRWPSATCCAMTPSRTP